jgi:hypothetical protein
MLAMNTYYIQARPPVDTKVFWDWSKPFPSKHATARELRFKARHRKGHR